MNEQLLNQISAKVSKAITAASLIQIEVSAKHVHLSQAHITELFGEGVSLTPKRDLSQPGQFLCEERVTLIGAKGKIERVAVLGPARGQTQVELSLTDCLTLGVKAPIRISGDVKGSASITVQGPKGSVTVEEGAIVAARHIHLTQKTASELGIADKQIVKVQAMTDRPLTFDDVAVRVSTQFSDRMHVDFDEANAAAIKGFTLGRIIK